jgi:hypothetical protein
MSPEASFEQTLTGGHPNSLGQTLEVVAVVGKAPERLRELIDTYSSSDEVVRLRVSSALKRLSREDPESFAKSMDYYLDTIADLDQPSAQWTRAQIALEMESLLSLSQRQRLTSELLHQLEHSTDWIVISHTLKTLGQWSPNDAKLAQALRPVATKHAQDPRKTVSAAAHRALSDLSE